MIICQLQTIPSLDELPSNLKRVMKQLILSEQINQTFYKLQSHPATLCHLGIPKLLSFEMVRSTGELQKIRQAG
jgi:hypothetical protein